ncbi:MAG TPA: 5'-3' exonuclease H3TH domain-containing protein, partial [Dehalococcoidia bacterium]|nr:5'-3' exonuclease H3TH domain-containing protein [Dehalococcoidia bacterium]
MPPASIPDYLALVGDTADGIPGIRGWGSRSAAAVLARYGHLEGIPEDPARWDLPIRGAPALAATLRQHWDAVMLYRTLAIL